MGADDRRDWGERRFKAFGMMDGRLHIAVFTPRMVGYASSVSGERAGRKRGSMDKNSVYTAECPDDDNPELTRAELRRARPARDMLPGLIGEKASAELLKGKGDGWATRTSRKDAYRCKSSTFRLSYV